VEAELPSTAALVTDGLGAVRPAASARARGVPARRELATSSPYVTEVLIRCATMLGGLTTQTTDVCAGHQGHWRWRELNPRLPPCE